MPSNLSNAGTHRTAPAVLAVAVALTAQNLGAAFAKGLFPAVGVPGVTALRVGLAAGLLLAVWRPWRAPVKRADLGNLVMYGAALGLMNLLIYEAFARIPIGVAIAIDDQATIFTVGIALTTTALTATTLTSITAVDAAIKLVNTTRATLGSHQNRLEHIVNNLGTTSENLSASESRIRDVDMAQEMMEYTKDSILSQAATAMLAQANQAPQGVLQLLR